MGALHAGHVALIAEAHLRADFIVVSVFVNPTQFGPSEDFAKYPRDLAADVAVCERAKVDVAFTPTESAMYPAGNETRVRPAQVASTLCGALRPGHFEGVATIVTKLLIVVGDCAAVFGRKDYQQLRVVSRLVADLFLPVEVVGVTTVRERDGVALSSRNNYLSTDDRAKARRIPLALSSACLAFAQGERIAGRLREMTHAVVAPVASSIDYVEVADPETLRVLRADERAGERVLVALALRLGTTRMIDNIVLGEDPSPIPEVELCAELKSYVSG
jgi:pantoate--beta-alanine ligase